MSRTVVTGTDRVRIIHESTGDNQPVSSAQAPLPHAGNTANPGKSPLVVVRIGNSIISNPA